MSEVLENQIFERLYLEHANLVFNLCFNYLKNTEEAEEATQDVFIKVHQNYINFDGKSSVKTWIYRISVNLCLDRLKAKNRKKRLARIKSIFSQDTGELIHDPSTFEHPGALLEDKEAVAEVFRAMEELPDTQKTAIILKSLEGLNQKEISEVMGITEKAVESLLVRARKKIKLILEKD